MNMDGRGGSWLGLFATVEWSGFNWRRCCGYGFTALLPIMATHSFFCQKSQKENEAQQHDIGWPHRKVVFIRDPKTDE